MKKLNLLFASFALVLGACSSDEPKLNDDVALPIELSRAEKDMVSAQTEFALNLYNAVVRSDEDCVDDNLSVSPVSMEVSLSMLANGATGNLLENILKTCGTADIDALNAFNARLLSSLPVANPSKVTLQFHNALWENSLFPVEPLFKSELKSSFDADIFEADFAAADMKSAVNNWVSERTDGLIPSFLSESIPQSTAMILMNVVYFKGKWMQPFSKKQTDKGDFHDSNGNVAQTVSLMNQKDVFRYNSAINGCQAVALPYGNGAFEMIVMLPEVGTTPQQLISALSAQTLTELVNSLEPDKIELVMPAFDVSLSINITEALNNMGLEFDGTSLTGISENIEQLSVLHATRLVVDETGTEAAAATGNLGFMSSGPGSLKKMEVNRPFAYLIRERSTGAILFIGHIANPAKN